LRRPLVTVRTDLAAHLDLHQQLNEPLQRVAKKVGAGSPLVKQLLKCHSKVSGHGWVPPLRCNGLARIEPNRGHSCQYESHGLEFAPLSGTLTAPAQPAWSNRCPRRPKRCERPRDPKLRIYPRTHRSIPDCPTTTVPTRPPTMERCGQVTCCEPALRVMHCGHVMCGTPATRREQPMRCVSLGVSLPPFSF